MAFKVILSLTRASSPLHSLLRLWRKLSFEIFADTLIWMIAFLWILSLSSSLHVGKYSNNGKVSFVSGHAVSRLPLPGERIGVSRRATRDKLFWAKSTKKEGQSRGQIKMLRLFSTRLAKALSVWGLHSTPQHRRKQPSPHAWSPSGHGGLTRSLSRWGRLGISALARTGSRVTRRVSPFSRFSDMLACERLLSSLLVLGTCMRSIPLRSPFNVSTKRTTRLGAGCIPEAKIAICTLLLYILYDLPAAVSAMQGQKTGAVISHSDSLLEAS